MHTSCRTALSGALICQILILAACQGESDASDRPQASVGSAAYVPGFGEIMSFQQMRHVKLWFAGTGENWDLAAYELDELSEGFDDLVTYHPTLDESRAAPRDLVPRLVAEPLDSLRASVERGDAGAFASAYDELTSACNGCHQAMDFGFNVVQRPATNPYSDQRFVAQ